MITENEVLLLISAELPEINEKPAKVGNNYNIYKVLQGFSAYTKQCAEARNIQKLKSCFALADKLLNTGNKTVVSAVENVYVYSVSSIIEMVSPIGEQVRKMLPGSIRRVYLKQINACFP